MNKDTTWNIIIGVLSAILIGGGAYVMTTGGLFNESPESQSANVESIPVNKDAELPTVAKSEIAQNNVKEKELSKEINKSKIMIQDGVTIEIKKEGTGDGIKSGQVAVVHYTGMFTDGKVFDSSIPRGQTFPVKLGAGMVIQGWDKGIVGMKKGELRRLTIPPELGYGTAGAGGVIPPNSTLVFDVELIDIK